MSEFLTQFLEFFNFYYAYFLKQDIGAQIGIIAGLISIIGLTLWFIQYPFKLICRLLTNLSILRQKDQEEQRLLNPKQEDPEKDIADLTPANLLLAKYQVVPFEDLHGQLKELIEWATGNEARFHAGRLYHGAGGLGKTRLFIEACSKLRKTHKWRAGFWEESYFSDPEKKAKLEELIASGRKNMLIVLDYAESRKDEIKWLAALIAEARKTCKRKCKLVLLARGAGEWWTDIQVDGDIKLVFSHKDGERDVHEIPEEIAAAQRESLFSVAMREYYEQVIGSSINMPFPSQDLVDEIKTREDYDRPLAILIRAILHIYGEKHQQAGKKLSDLLDDMLTLERDHWQKIISENFDKRHFLRAIQQVTLVMGGSVREVQNLLMQDSHFDRQSPSQTDDVLGWLTRLYGSDDHISGLEPDLLGEHLVADIDKELLADTLDWAKQNQKQRNILTVLQRGTRQDHGPKTDGNKKHLAYILTKKMGNDKELAKDIINTAIETPGALAEVIEGNIANIPSETLKTLSWNMPSQTLILRKTSATMSEILSKQVKTQEGEVDKDKLKAQADELIFLGNRYSNLGRREDALQATEEAVELYRKLAEQNPDAFAPDLAMSLNNLGNRYSNLGRREDALQATEEAVELRRKLAEQNPDAFAPDLASSLNNLGNRYSALGRREDALEATEEAVELYRKLAEQNPDAFAPNLAGTFNNLGMVQSNLGRREDALQATEEAVRMLLPYLKQHPQAFEVQMNNHFGNYLQRYKEAETSPDQSLVNEVQSIIGQ